LRRARRAARVAAWIAGALLAAGAAAQRPSAPRPDLATVEPTLRGWLERAHGEVEALLAAEGVDPLLAAAALGDLGRVYQVFGLDESALAAYAGAVALAPEEFRWTYLQAVFQFDMADLAAAEAGLRRALELQPDAAFVLQRLGDLALERGEPEAARALFQRVLDREPDAAAALYGVGRVLAALGDDAGAAANFERALALQPTAALIHYPLAQAYRRLGREADAARHLALRGARPPSFPDPLLDELEDFKNLVALQVTTALAADAGDRRLDEVLGFALAHLGNVEGVVPPLREVIAQRRAAGAPAAELGRLEYLAGGLLVRQNRDAEAVDHFRAASEHLPARREPRLMLGNALARVRRYAEAEEVFSRLLADDANDAEALLKRATVRLNLDQVAAARQDLDTLLRRSPGDLAARLRLAEVLERSGDARGALAAYGAALSPGLADADAAAVHEALCGFHQRRGQVAAAVEACRAALARDPGRRVLRLPLAALLGAGGAYAEALAEYRQLLAADPGHETARAGAAAALVLLERYAEARSTLEEGLVQAPRSVLLQHLLARLLAAAPDAAVRDGRRALDLALALHRVAPAVAAAETVAMAYAEVGDFTQALAWQEHAQSAGADRVLGGARLDLYRSRQAYHARRPEELLVPPPPA
jgi:predicted Zn-dependent protease